MKPTKSYRIWHTPRTGSTLLCEALSSTNIAGKPQELFNINETTTLLQHYEVTNYETLQQLLWQKGCSGNKVMAIKAGYYTTGYQRILQELATLQGQSSNLENEAAVWSSIFPNCKHIYITRRNKLRQAISWWKAIQDNVWHLRNDERRKQTSDFYDDKYDFNALAYLVKEAALREAATQAYFERNGIIPFTVVYEDFIRNYEATILQILDFLQLPKSGVRIAPKVFQRTANAHSELWVERLRVDLQKGMEQRMIY